MKSTKFLIVPKLANKPVEDLLHTVTIASIFDMQPVLERGEPAVLSFEDVNDIDVVLKYPRIFGDDFALLVGYPGAEYSASLEATTSLLDRVSYDTLVLELNAAKRAAYLKRLETESSVDKQDRTLNRVDGTRKEFSDFDIPNGDSND